MQPMGLAEGAVVLREVKKDDVLRIEDVKLPPRRLIDSLRQEQDFLVGD